jgi:hypothetical protein
MQPYQGRTVREHWLILVVPRGRRHGDFPFCQRWTIETTVAESRAPLGCETRRPWVDHAMERPAPCQFGLDSVRALLAHALPPDGEIPIHTTAWYRKSQAAFADVLAATRRYFWGECSASMSAHAPDVLEISRAELERFADAVCGAH